MVLGRALLPDSATLLLDEPVSAFDAPLRQRLRAGLVATLGGWGKTTVLVTHDLAEACELAAQIVAYDRRGVLQSAARRDAVRHLSFAAVARIAGMRKIPEGTVAQATPERIWLHGRGHVLEIATPRAPPACLRRSRRCPSSCTRARLPDPEEPPRPGSRSPSRHPGGRDRRGPGPRHHAGADRPPRHGRRAREGTADLEIEMSPLVDEVLEVDRHQRSHLFLHPAALHVLPERDGPADTTRTPTAMSGELRPEAGTRRRPPPRSSIGRRCRRAGPLKPGGRHIRFLGLARTRSPATQ